MLTFSTGAKEVFHSRNPKLDLYLGIGVTMAFVWTYDQSNFVQRNQTRIGAGLVGKSGFLYRLKKDFFADLFFDYYYQPTYRDNFSATVSLVDLGGFRTDVGIQYVL